MVAILRTDTENVHLVRIYMDSIGAQLTHAPAGVLRYVKVYRFLADFLPTDVAP